jgi:5-methylcytosine-specific restriction enzyme subunit McrC
MSGMSIKSIDNDLEIFTLLIPTENLFEDFLFGFIKDKFQYNPNIRAIQNQGDGEGKQRSLAIEKDEFGNTLRKSFRLKPDIYIIMESKDIILDSKYKAIYSKEEAMENDKNNNNNGVLISDIYQMLAYTVKLDVNICHLIYPDIIGVNDKLGSHYEITHKNQKGISKIYYHRVPTLIENEIGELIDIIEEKERQLYDQLNNIFYV